MVVKIRLLVTVVILLTFCSLVSPSYSNQIPLRADRLDILFDPDFPIAESSLLAHYEKKNFVWVYREIIPIQVGGFTYFAILGSNGDEYPNYYGGVQFFKDGTYGGGKASIFSAWDPKKLYCTYCSRESENVSKESQVGLWKQGDRTVVRPFGNEGTGLNSMIHGFPWKLGEKVSMLASIEPAGSGSLITSAIRLGESSWELMASFYVPARYSSGMNGNYAFLEDFEAPGNLNETVPRSFLVGPTYLEDNKGNGTFFTNVYVAASNTETPNITPVRHKVTVEGSWLRVESGTQPQANTSSTYRLTLEKPAIKPNLELGKALILKAIEGKSTRQQEAIAAELKAKQEAEAKAAAELKAKQEAEAKAAAELKAKQEAEAKAAAEQKAKQEAEAKAAAEQKAKQEAEAKAAAEQKAKQEAEAKAAAEQKAKQEAEAKAAAELKAKQEAEAKAAAELKAKQEAAAELKAKQEAAAAELKAKQEAEAKAAAELKSKQEAAAKAAAAKKATITCTKGKLTKKVTAVKPKCPVGYKKK